MEGGFSSVLPSALGLGSVGVGFMGGWGVQRLWRERFPKGFSSCIVGRGGTCL